MQGGAGNRRGGPLPLHGRLDNIQRQIAQLTEICTVNSRTIQTVLNVMWKPEGYAHAQTNEHSREPLAQEYSTAQQRGPHQLHPYWDNHNQGASNFTQPLPNDQDW
jgi:hypothetical protein